MYRLVLLVNRLPRHPLGAALAALSFTAFVIAPAAAANPTPEGAAANLNAWRAELGEAPASTTVPAWNTGCNHHDNYEHVNGNSLTHLESSSNPGYTTDGAEAAEDSVLAAAVSAPGPTPDASLLPGPTWDAAVFHRAALLQPRLAQIGFDSSTFLEAGVYRTFECLWAQNQAPDPPQALDNNRTTPGLTLYPSPGNGAYDVPTAFPAGSESPDPGAETGVPPGAALGWMLSVEINGPWANAGAGYVVAAHGVTATLAPDGTSNFVPIVVSQCGSSGCGGSGGTAEGPYFQGGFGLFPTQPLAPNTTYRVVLTGGTVTDQMSHAEYPIPSGYSWCFSTGAVYAASADCAPPTTAAEEQVNPNASTALSFTQAGGSSPGGSGQSTATGPKPTRCVVPRLTAKKLSVAKRKIRAANCRLGKVRTREGVTRKSGRVVKQGAKPGATLPAGAKIEVTLGKG